MLNFKKFNLPNILLQSLEHMGITSPTAIQEASIALSLEGRDILASAETGSGKTLAYALPLTTHLLNTPTSGALILAPTRELAVQIKDAVLKLLGRTSPVKAALLIGGDSMPKQLSQLRARPRLIVGTPGRINDHLNRGSLSLKETTFLVVDEADRMLDMGFGIQLDRIAQYLPRKRQTLMFSATMTPNIVKLADKYLTNPERVTVGSTSKPAANIKQQIIHTTASEKFGHLLKELNEREGPIIVFVKTKRGTEQLADKLERQNQSVGAVHGDLRQRKREQVILAFRNQKNRIMVATDVAARGLDIPDVMHVINYDLPQCPEDYIHRIGRTARAGKEGNALCLISPEDGQKWKAIHRLINPGQALENPEKFSEASRGDNPGRNRRFKSGEGQRQRFGKSERWEDQSGRSGKPRDRFGKPEGERKAFDKSSDFKTRPKSSFFKPKTAPSSGSR